MTLFSSWLSVTYVTGKIVSLHIPVVFEGMYVKKLAMMGQESLLGINMVLKPLGVAVDAENLQSVELTSCSILGSRTIIETDQLITK
jgi:hypothetical protein